MTVPIKLPSVPKVPQIPSIPRVPKVPIPKIVAIPALATLITKALKASKLQLPSLPSIPNPVSSITSRLKTMKQGLEKSAEKAKLPMNTVERLKEQAESYKSKYTFDVVKGTATAGLADKLNTVKTTAEKTVTTQINSTIAGA